MSLSTHEPVDTVVERLIEQYGQEVYKIAYFYMKETQLAEDVFQEVFYKVIKNYHKFNHQSSEKTWLIRITINTCKDMLRTSWIKRVTTFGVWQDSENEYEKPYDIEKKETNKIPHRKRTKFYQNWHKYFISSSFCGFHNNCF